MITRRKLLVGFVLSNLSSAFPLFAQQPKIARIGILSARARSTPSSPDPHFDAFVRGMRELGYVDGQNIILDWWFADDRYDRLAELAAGLVQAKPDVIVTHATPAVAALMRVTKTIPIVMTSVTDPVGNRFTSSLAQPDKNVTGMTQLADLSLKYVELLKVLLPKMSQLGMLVNFRNPIHPALIERIRSAAQSRGVHAHALPVAVREEIGGAFERARKEKFGAIIVVVDSLFLAQRRLIASLGIRNKIPTIANSRAMVADGVLMSYGSDSVVGYHRAATYVDKILKGAKPGDLPIEQPSKFELVVNLKTAKVLGLKVPQEILVRADETIE